jgi:hypothetical protein
MILSVEVIDTVFRGLPVPDDVTKMYQPKQGCFPTTILRKGYGRKGLRRTVPLYNCWSNMFQRCLSGSSQQDKIKSYVGCNHMFSDYQDFAEFCYTLPFFRQLDQFNNPYEIDKDVKGFIMNLPNTYSKETIIMLPKDINCFLTCVQIHNNSTERSTKGVIQHVRNKFQVRTQDVCGDRQRKVMSKHATYDEAYSALCDLKQTQARFLADKFKGKVDNVVVDFLMKFSLREWEKWTYHKWSCK